MTSSLTNASVTGNSTYIHQVLQRFLEYARRLRRNNSVFAPELGRFSDASTTGAADYYSSVWTRYAFSNF
jgi:hypothetical protein